MTANYFGEDAAILSIWFWQEPPENVRQSMNQRQFYTVLMSLSHRPYRSHTHNQMAYILPSTMSVRNVHWLNFGSASKSVFLIDFTRWFVVCFQTVRALLAFFDLFFLFFLMTEWGAHKLPFEPHLRQRKILSKTMVNDELADSKNAVLQTQ